MTEGPRDQKLSAYPKRTKAALILVFLLAIASAYTLLVSPPEPGLDVTGFEKRFAPLREALPQRGMVGYVSDSDFIGEFYLTQYTLAPVVVYLYPSGFATSTPRPTLVVGNFNSPASIPDVLARNGLMVKRDFGDGVLLLEAEAR